MRRRSPLSIGLLTEPTVWRKEVPLLELLLILVLICTYLLGIHLDDTLKSMYQPHSGKQIDQKGCDLGSCFHFIPDINYLGEWKNASPITALALEVGSRQSGYSRLMQMQSHPGTNKPPMTQRFDLVSGRPWCLSVSSLLLSLTMTHFFFFDAFWLLIFKSYLLSEL